MLWYIDAVMKPKYPISFPAIAHESYAGTLRRKIHIVETAARHSKHILVTAIEYFNLIKHFDTSYFEWISV